MHTSLCAIALSEYQWTAARAECERAIELKPNSTEAHTANADLLVSLGRWQPALEEAQRARQLDPVSPSRVGIVLLWSRDYARAIEAIRAEVELNPSYAQLRWWLGMAYLLSGRSAEAMREFEKSVELGDRTARWRLGCAYALSGRRSEAEQILRELEKAPGRPYGYRARLLTALGRKDEALLWLEKALASGIFVEIRDPLFDPLRQEARFREVLRRMNLEN